MQRYLTPQDIRTWTRWTGGRHGREVTSAYLFLKPPRIDWIRVIAQAPRAAKTTCFSLKLSRQDVMNQAEPWKASTVDFFSRRLEYRAKGYLAGPFSLDGDGIPNQSAVYFSVFPLAYLCMDTHWRVQRLILLLPITMPVNGMATSTAATIKKTRAINVCSRAYLASEKRKKWKKEEEIRDRRCHAIIRHTPNDLTVSVQIFSFCLVWLHICITPSCQDTIIPTVRTTRQSRDCVLTIVVTRYLYPLRSFYW